MRTDFYYDSCGGGTIHACRWMPQGKPRAVLQIVHGIADYALRYDDFAGFLTDLGYLIVAEDHMGYGGSYQEGQTLGYFEGGWFGGIEDTYKLLTDTKKEFPDIPYILFGHSMGSFMARSILAKYPDSGIAAAVICGTAWMPDGMISAAAIAAKLICKVCGERTPSKLLHNMSFGGYNARVEHPRTACDWISRDEAVVDAYVADPMCGFVATAGLMRDMSMGISYIQKPKNLNAMRKDLPVFFIAGGDDPVGGYGKGVRQAADKFREAGMKNVSVKIYPLCRHEILNEINRREVYADVASWMSAFTGITVK